jgi:RimJ/RimL family protein N-acetyltransferase
MFIHGMVYIRSIEEGDLQFLAECRNAMSTWKYLGTIDFTNKIKQLEWWKASSLDKSKSYFILCSFADDTRIGFVRMDEIDHFNKSIRIGGDIHPDFRKQGWGTRMYHLLLNYCFDQLNMHRVWLFVLHYNDKAIGLYEKMGFKCEGAQRQAVFRDGAYHDYLMMSILESEYRGKNV